MLEYKLSRDLSRSELFELYRSCLRRDQQWHFFHEGSYALLRVAKRNEHLEQWISDHGMRYTTGTWRDYPIVEKYKKQFTKIFHAFSVLAVENDSWQPEYGDEWSNIRDRVLHSFFVMNGYQWDSECRQLGNEFVNRMIHTISQYTYSLVKEKEVAP